MTEGGMVDASRPGYRQVAATLRERILSGAEGYRPGDYLKGNPALAAEFGKVSTAIVNAAVSQLAAEGLVRVEHGKQTEILGQRPWRASVTVRWRGDPAIPAGVLAAASSAVTAGVAADPAVSAPSSDYVLTPSTFDTPGYPALITEMTVLASDMALAGARAWAITRDALRGNPGWDLEKPSASQRPA
jgi:DNA-binding transcriptional MocR family regulator